MTKLIAVVATMLLVATGALVALAVIRPGQSIAGTAVMAPVTPGEASLLDPLPTEPAEQWRVDTGELFGTQAGVQYLMAVAATEDEVIVAGQPPNFALATLTALTPDGQPLWDRPSDFLGHECAFSATEALACLTYDKNDDTAPRGIGFLDPQNGEVLRTEEIDAPGWPDIQRAGDGFLVSSSSYPGGAGDGSVQETLTWFSSGGDETWTHTPPPGVDSVELSETGGVVAVTKYDVGAQVLDLRSGELLYDAADDLAAMGDGGSVWIVPHAAGFVVGLTTPTGEDGNRAVFYNSTGSDVDEWAGWTTVFLAPATEGNRVALSNNDDNKLAVVSVGDRETLWEQDDVDMFDNVEFIADRYVAVVTDPITDATWTVYDAESGDRESDFEVTIHQSFRGFDGTRLIFEGDPSGDEPGPGGMTAFDVSTGKSEWRYKVTQSADDVNLGIVGPFLFRYDARLGAEPAAISRLGSA